MNLKVYEKIIWMFELGATHLLKLKGTPLVHPDSTLRSTSGGAINEGLLSNKSFKTKLNTNPLKLKLNTFVNFIRKFEFRVIWLRG